MTNNTKNNKIAVIDGIVDGHRISTQQLLQEVYKKLEDGYTEFEVNACGQHNIGGPLWDKDDKPLKFRVKNPGQRLGSMGKAGTTIEVEGSAPADVGWLNAGAEIILKGDGGDTTAHCAATGKIYVGGRTGTRSGALMKFDPKYSMPEFWVLENTGSFSFEFMGGGIGVICGYGCEELESILGKRSCVGMVGGTVYVRGNVKDLSDEVYLLDLDGGDREFLYQNLPIFLKKIGKPELLNDLAKNLDKDIPIEWKKIVAKTYQERTAIKETLSIQEFRQQKWVEGGIFSTVLDDDFSVANLVATGDNRLRIPEWRNAAYSAPCEYNCPIGIPTQKRIALLREGKTEEALKLVLEYSPFPASVCGQVCPNLCVNECNRKFLDIPVKIDELGMLSSSVKVDLPPEELKERVAIIGSGSAGLGAAWQLRKLGYQVEVFEQDEVFGGKLRQVIPKDRLERSILEAELQRIKDIGVKVKLNTPVNKELFNKIKSEYDAVVVATGAHNPVVIPFEGHERLVKGLDFLKKINKGEKPKTGEKVVVIGAGNSAMDVVIGAYGLGAKEVTAIDIQKPAAFDKEIKHAKDLGAKILYPVFTDKITDKGVILKDGKLLEADMVIISVGDRPDLSFLEREYLDEKGMIQLNDYSQSKIEPKVFAPGDVSEAGLFTNALASGRRAAMNIHRMISGQPLSDYAKAPMIPQDRIKKEFYPQMNSGKVNAIPAEQEADRCMSCGYCRDCEYCLESCPEQAIDRIQNPNGTFEYVSNPDKCIGCGICAGVCPCGIWTMEDNLIKFNEE